MPVKRCRFGFNCGLMMMMPGLAADDCPNRETCGLLSELTPEEELELIRVRERTQERIRITAHQAAIMMLRQRGCPQSPESLGILQAIRQIELKLSELHERLSDFDDTYIAPLGCEAHVYSVKRPLGIYKYNKLTAETPIFEPSERVNKVRVIHLSHTDDPRDVEAREGIKRRNKLLSILNRINHAERLLSEVLAEI